MLASLQRLCSKPTVPVIRVHGPILQQSAEHVQRALDRINPATAKALAVLVNSPGGLPAQSDIICAKIKGFAHEHHIPLYTFAEDVAASGGYVVLTVGDKVFVDSSSVVGSIGVVGQQMSFHKWLKKYEVENRKFASDENSIIFNLDPFSSIEEQSKSVEKFKEAMVKMHQVFITHVENHRRIHLTVPESERLNKIYNGDLFNGEEAVSLGLADRVGNYLQVLPKLYPECEIVHVSHLTRFQELLIEAQKSLIPQI